MSFDEQPDPLSDCMEAYDRLKKKTDKELASMAAHNLALREALEKIAYHGCGCVNPDHEGYCSARTAKEALSLPKSHHEERVAWLEKIAEAAKIKDSNNNCDIGNTCYSECCDFASENLSDVLVAEPKSKSEQEKS